MARPRVFAVVVGRDEPGKRLYDAGDSMFCLLCMRSVSEYCYRSSISSYDAQYVYLFTDVLEKQLFGDSIYHLWRDCSLLHAMSADERQEAIATEVSHIQYTSGMEYSTTGKIIAV